MIIHLDIAVDTIRGTVKLPDGTKFATTIAHPAAIVAATLELAKTEATLRSRAKSRGLTSTQIQLLVDEWLASGNMPTIAADSMSTEQMEEALASLLENIT